MNRSSLLALALAVLSTSCEGGGGRAPIDPSAVTPLGEEHTGQYHLGPVDWQESRFHNSCAPYPSSVRTILGDDLAGLELTYNGDGQLCDACVKITTAAGRSVVARVVTTGVSQPNDIDLSPHAFEALHLGEYPRTMSWQIVTCPADDTTIRYQYQTEANVWWTSLWVRNPHVPLASVEVRSGNHPSFVALDRGSDGTYTDGSGFGDGPFTLRLTSIDGQILEESFDGFSPGGLVVSAYQFE